MSWIFGEAVMTEPYAVPAPPLTLGYWLDGVAAPMPSRFTVFAGLSIVVRKDAETDGGVATAGVVVDEDGNPGVQVAMTYSGVWDVVLVDSFQDNPCPGIEPNAPIVAGQHFYLGAEVGLRKMTRSNVDGDTIVRARLRPAPVAPAGLTARCEFRAVYLAVRASTSGWLLLTPIVDGERITEEATVVPIPQGADGRPVRRFEVVLSRTRSGESRQGLVGTWFTFDAEALDATGCGRLSLDGWELEYAPLTESLNGQVFTGEEYAAVVASPVSRFFVGGDGPGIRRGAVGTDDAGAPIPMRLQTAEVAPAGAGGEALFQNAYLILMRRNTEDWGFTFTPVVDGEELQPVSVTLQGIEPVVLPGGTWHRQVAEVVEVPLAQNNGYVTFAPRGAWMAGLIKATTAPDDAVELHGVELEYEVLTESLVDVTNA